jgi:hypothetical protein
MAVTPGSGGGKKAVLGEESISFDERWSASRPCSLFRSVGSFLPQRDTFLPSSQVILFINAISCAYA